jgi:hypothetical protein
VHVELSIERSDLETIFLDRCFDSVVRAMVFAKESTAQTHPRPKRVFALGVCDASVNVQNVAVMLPFISVF